MLDFNQTGLSDAPLNVAINHAIATAAALTIQEPRRQYLGASAVGNACPRKVQYDWQCDPTHPVRLLDVFARGHLFEDLSRQRFMAAGFRFAPAEALAFTALHGAFRGHADGIITGGPILPGVGYPCLWEHKCINAKWWRSLERDGLEKTYPQYAVQVSLYQFHLNVGDHPAIFTAVNADTCERLNLLVPFYPDSAKTWSDRALKIIMATQAGELLPRFTDNPTDWRCKMCSHRERCWR